MRSTFFAVTATLATIPLTHAAKAGYQGDNYYMGSDAPQGKVYIHNECSTDYYMWPVSAVYSPTDDDYVLLGAGTVQEYDVIIPEKGCACGTSFKISKEQSMSTSETQLEYSLRDTGDRSTWCLSYDISLVDCATRDAQGAMDMGFEVYEAVNCPGHPEGMLVYGANGSNCGAMECAAGQFCPYDVYFRDIPGLYQPVRQCDDGSVDADIHFVLCSGSTASGGDPSAANYKIPTVSDNKNANNVATTNSPVVSAAASSTPTPKPSSAAPETSEQAPAPSTSSTAQLEVVAAAVPSVVESAASTFVEPIVTAAAVLAEVAPLSTDLAQVIITVLTTVEIYPNGEKVYPRTWLA